MTSPVTDVIDQWATDWEAATPPTRTSVTYHQVDTKCGLRGAAGDRSFWFDMPVRVEPVAEMGAATTDVKWSVVANLRLQRRNLSMHELFDAVANESNLLFRTLETRSTWPTGVLEVVTETTKPTMDDGGDVIIAFPCRVWTQETD